MENEKHKCSCGYCRGCGSLTDDQIMAIFNKYSFHSYWEDEESGAEEEGYIVTEPKFIEIGRKLLAAAFKIKE